MRLTLLFALTAISAMGCNCAGREITVSRTFNVHGETTDPLCNADRQVINLADDASFKDAKAFIGTVELRKLEGEITNPKTRADSAATKASGTVRIADSMTGTALDLGTYGDVAITAGNKTTIQFDKKSAKRLAELVLQPPNSFSVESYGCNDANPAFYEFKVTLTIFAGL